MVNFENHPLHPGEAIPLFISAGPLKETAQAKQFLEVPDPRLVPLLTWGGFTLPWNAGNGEPDFEYDPVRKAAGNSRGLPNGGVEAIKALKEPIKALTERGIKTIIQVTNLPSENPLDVIPLLVEVAADSRPTAVEINFACPNGMMPDGSFHPPTYRDPDTCGEILEISREAVGGITLLAKDGPHTNDPFVMPDPDTVYDFVNATRDWIDGVVGINTIAAQKFAGLTKTGGKGGMSGPIVADVAKHHSRLWGEFAPEVPYLATGGIDSGNAETEIPERLAEPNIMRVGGTQEFYRSRNMANLAARWAIAAA